MERIRMCHEDIDHVALGMQALDPTQVKMTGQITDRIFKNGILIEERVDHNIIVNSFLKLVMALCKGEAGYGGIKYWAIGSGENSWDESTPNAEINATRLTSEFSRVQISPAEISFINASSEIVGLPTNIIQITHVFGPNDCNGKWREFGIFGGNATSATDSGIMINKKHHSVITKTSDMTIERTMKFTINLV